MREVPVSAFLPMLRTMVNVPLEPLMESAVVEAAIEFCRKSSVLLHQREMAHVYKGQTISLLAKSGVNRRTRGLLKSAKLLSVFSMRDGVTLESGKDFRQLSLDEVYFLKAFDDVVINCVMEPLTGTSYLPALLLDDWGAGICSGAAKTLLLQPDKDWSDPSLAVYYEREFKEAMRDAARWRLEASPNVMFTLNANRKREFF